MRKDSQKKLHILSCLLSLMCGTSDEIGNPRAGKKLRRRRAFDVTPTVTVVDPSTISRRSKKAYFGRDLEEIEYYLRNLEMTIGSMSMPMLTSRPKADPTFSPSSTPTKSPGENPTTPTVTLAPMATPITPSPSFQPSTSPTRKNSPAPTVCDCPAGLELQGTKCYTQCPPGTNGEELIGIADSCQYSCPPGFQDFGDFCIYGVLGAFDRGDPLSLANCESLYGIGNCEECGIFNDDEFYPLCPDFTSPSTVLGCSFCGASSCPTGFASNGPLSCSKPDPIGRAVLDGMVPMECTDAEEINTFASCLVTAFEAQKSLINFEAIRDTYADFANVTGVSDFATTLSSASCPVVNLPDEYIAELTDCIGFETGITIYAGIIAEASFGGEGILSVGSAVDSRGDTGCFYSGCQGGGFTFGADISVFLGVLINPSICKLGGFSGYIDIDLNIDPLPSGGVGVEATLNLDEANPFADSSYMVELVLDLSSGFEPTIKDLVGDAGNTFGASAGLCGTLLNTADDDLCDFDPGLE